MTLGVLGGINTVSTQASADSMVSQGLYYQISDAKFYLVINSPLFANISWQFDLGWQGVYYIKVRYTNNTGAVWTAWKEL